MTIQWFMELGFTRLDYICICYTRRKSTDWLRWVGAWSCHTSRVIFVKIFQIIDSTQQYRTVWSFFLFHLEHRVLNVMLSSSVFNKLNCHSLYTEDACSEPWSHVDGFKNSKDTISQSKSQFILFLYLIQFHLLRSSPSSPFLKHIKYHIHTLHPSPASCVERYVSERRRTREKESVVINHGVFFILWENATGSFIYFVWAGRVSIVLFQSLDDPANYRNRVELVSHLWNGYYPHREQWRSHRG